MIYRELNATFGKLTEKTLHLTDGLNVVYGPNGAGKSTWSAFLRVMLYGLSTREQNKIGFLADKEKYKPWSGLPMYGTLRMTVSGRPLTLERTAGKNGLFAKMTAVYEDTGRPADLPDPPGETLLGMKREVFERSVFTAQGGLSVTADKDGELARKITALVQTGDAEASFSSAKARLEKWRRAKRYQKSGTIPETERNLEEALALYREIRREEEALTDLLAQKSELEDRVSRLSAQCAGKKLEQIRCAEDALMRAERELESLPREEALDALETALSEQKQNKIVSHETLKIALFAALLGAVCGGAAWILHAWKLGAAVGVGVFCAVFALCACLKYGKTRKKRSALLKEIDETAPLATAWEVLARERTRAERARQEVLFAEERLTILVRDVSTETLKQIAVQGASEDADAARLEELQRELFALEMECTKLRERLRAKGSAAEVGERIGGLRAELSAEQKEYDALTLAIETLSEVNGELERRFAPKLEQTAGELLTRITDGEFTVVEWSGSEFSLTVREHVGAPPRSILSLSKGTLDELYLCLRLAICENVLSGEESVPLILDDVFAFCDEARLARMLDFLKDLAKKRQIILFTCHRREALLLQGEAGVHTVELG